MSAVNTRGANQSVECRCGSYVTDTIRVKDSDCGWRQPAGDPEEGLMVAAGDGETHFSVYIVQGKLTVGKDDTFK